MALAVVVFGAYDSYPVVELLLKNIFKKRLKNKIIETCSKTFTFGRSSLFGFVDAARHRMANP